MAGEDSSSSVKFSVNLKFVTLLLLATIAVMLAIWKPWTSRTTNDRTVVVSGQATVKAEPDEYAFFPTYSFKNTDKSAALKELTAKSDEVVAKLKELGVKDKDIKTSSSGSDYPWYYNQDSKENVYTLQPAIMTSTREQAQKVQSYLVTTSPTGTVSPQTNFSDTLRKKLESDARDAATKDARSKADQLAKNTGFTVGKVKEVNDGGFAGGGGCGPYGLCAGIALSADAKSSSVPELAVQPGENKLSYSVTVTYFIK